MTPGYRLGRTVAAIAAMLLMVGCGSGGESATSAPGAPPKPIDANVVPPTTVGMNLAPPGPGDAPSFANTIQAYGDYWLVTDTGWDEHSAKIQMDDGGHPINVKAGTWIVVSATPGPPTTLRKINCTVSPGWNVSIHDVGDLGPVHSFSSNLSTDKDGNLKGGLLKFQAIKDGARLDVACRNAQLPSSAIIDPELLSSVKPFRVVRFMEWMFTNNAPHRDWAKRPTPSDMTFVNTGVPIEYMVQLANEGHVDPWFTLPWDASPDYYRNFATYVRDHLAPDRVAYVELSNEVWNGAFTQARDNESQGKSAYPHETGAHPNDYYYADRVRALMDVWSDVFKGQEKRIARVIGAQGGWPERADDMLAHKGTWRSVDMLATAPYFGTDGFEVKTDDAKTRIDTLFKQGPQEVDAWIKRAKMSKTIAAKYGLRYGSYEGGPGYVNGVPQVQAQLTQMTRDPRMYDLYSLFLNRWQKEVGGLFMAFNSVGQHGQYGTWSHLEYPTQPLSEAPKQRALVDFIAKLPPTK